MVPGFDRPHDAVLIDIGRKARGREDPKGVMVVGASGSESTIQLF